MITKVKSVHSGTKRKGRKGSEGKGRGQGGKGRFREGRERGGQGRERPGRRQQGWKGPESEMNG